MKINIEITNLCNSKCKNCNIWKNKKAIHITVENIRQILNSGIEIESIGITGGEPFLNPEIVDIINEIGKHNIKMNMTTNGIGLDYYLDILDCIEINALRKLAIFVSIDGLGVTHDNLRGIGGNFISAIRFINELSGSYNEFIRYLGISTTITKENYKELFQICALATTFNAIWSCRFKSNSYYYDNENSVIEKFNNSELKVINTQINKAIKLQKDSNLMTIEKENFMKKLIKYYKNPSRMFYCNAMKDKIFINSDGRVRACSQMLIGNGNINNDKLNNIMNYDSNWSVRRIIEVGECDCWTECECL